MGCWRYITAACMNGDLRMQPVAYNKRLNVCAAGMSEPVFTGSHTCIKATRGVPSITRSSDRGVDTAAGAISVKNAPAPRSE